MSTILRLENGSAPVLRLEAFAFKGLGQPWFVINNGGHRSERAQIFRDLGSSRDLCTNLRNKTWRSDLHFLQTASKCAESTRRRRLPKSCMAIRWRVKQRKGQGADDRQYGPNIQLRPLDYMESITYSSLCPGEIEVTSNYWENNVTIA